MTDTEIHSCGYYCDRPLCIKAQRDELRNKLFSEQAVKTQTSHDTKKEWVGLTDEDITAIKSKYGFGANIFNFISAIRELEVELKEKNYASS